MMHCTADAVLLCSSAYADMHFSFLFQKLSETLAGCIDLGRVSSLALCGDVGWLINYCPAVESGLMGGLMLGLRAALNKHSHLRVKRFFC